MAGTAMAMKQRDGCMGRWAARVVFGLALLWMTPVFALGLGDLRLDSALNQNFSAEIPLVNVGDLEAAEILPSLATAEDFERVGVERFFYLTDLRFRVDLSNPSDPVLQVTSSRPITEPFLNFLVEVLWPNGRLLREFTVLLDPPTYSDGPLVSPIRPASDGGGGNVSRPAPPTPATSTSASTQRTGGGATGSPGGGGSQYGVTDRDDTLWEIALRTRPDRGLSVHQMMLALVDANPDAFIAGNINLLKAGYVLRVPDADRVRSISRADAIARVQAQNEAWRDGTVGGAPLRAPLDARSPNGGRGGGPVVETGELRLVGEGGSTGASTGATRPGAGGSRGDGASTAGGGADPAQLVAAQDEIERLVRDRRDLVERIEVRENEIETLESKLEVQDSTIAELQAQLAQARKVAQQALEASKTPRSAPAPAPSLLTHPLVLGLGGLVVVLLAAMGWMAMRSRSGSGDVAMPARYPRTAAAAAPAAAATASAASALDATTEDAFAGHDVDAAVDTSALGDTMTADGADATEFEGGGDDVAEEVPPTSADVLADADIYIAYGQFPQAVTFLRNALEAEPERQDIRVKLLEVYVETGDVEGFDEEAARISASGDPRSIALADELQAKLPGTRPIEGAAQSFDQTVIDSGGFGVQLQRPEGFDDVEDDDVDLDLDIDLDDSVMLKAGSGATEIEHSIGDELDALDLDLSALDAGADEDTGTSGPVVLDDDLDLDLDLDAAVGQKPAGTPGDDFALDDLELDETVSLDDSTRLDSGEDDDLDDLDFDLDEPGDLGSLTASPSEEDAREPATPNTRTTTSTLDDTSQFSIDDLDDIDLDETAAASDGPLTNEVVAAEDDFDLTLDGDADIEPVTPMLREDSTGGLDDTSEFDLTMNEESVPVTAPTGPAQDPFDLEELTRAETLETDLQDLKEATAAAETIELDTSPLSGGEALDLDDALDLDLDGDDDDVATKLDLARGFIDMGDKEGARDILSEVASDGAAEQQDEARRLLAELD